MVVLKIEYCGMFVIIVLIIVIYCLLIKYIYFVLLEYRFCFVELVFLGFLGFG